MPLNNLLFLQRAIRGMYGCDSRHAQSVRVTETFAAELAWEGVVELFDLIDCADGARCYAWAYREKSENKALVVLETAEVNSAQKAVQKAIAARLRQR